MSFRNFFSLFILLCAIGSTWANDVSGDLEKLKIAIVSRTVFYAPLWVARDSGFFTQQGINVEIEVFDSAEKITEALKSGSVQIAISTPEGVVVDAYRNGPIRIIAGNAKRLPHFLIAQSNYKTTAQLRGANFGVLSMNEGTTYLVRQFAQSVGLKPEEYKITQVGGAPTRWRLLQEGKIDAGLQPFPLSYEAEAKGFKNFGAIAHIVVAADPILTTCAD